MWASAPAGGMVTAGRVKGRKGEDGKVVGGRKWRGCAQATAVNGICLLDPKCGGSSFRLCKPPTTEIAGQGITPLEWCGIAEAHSSECT